MKKLREIFSLGLALLSLAIASIAQEPKALPLPDERYKADLLLLVAHPDDEGAATPYLARALDEHKRIAVVFGTRGSSGANEAGAEQAAALGAVREVEARNALTTLGITNVWFLDGKDTASQNVLQSLANWDHGESLEQLVRLVRLTRPEVILTFLSGCGPRRYFSREGPGVFGEGNFQVEQAGVLANGARFFPCAPDASQILSRQDRPNGRSTNREDGDFRWRLDGRFTFRAWQIAGRRERNRRCF